MLYSSSLKQNHLFRQLYHKGRSGANKYMVIYCRKNRLSANRVGYTVSKKLGCAVVRNRTRRRLREIYRLNEAAFLPGYDIVIVARSAAVKAPFSTLQASFLALAGSLSLLKGGQA